MRLTLQTENYEHSASVEQRGKSLYIDAPYHPELTEEIRRFDRASWLRGPKQWRFPASHRNLWSLEAMSGGDCVDRYRSLPPESLFTEADVFPMTNAVTGQPLKLRLKQFEMVRWALHKRQCIWGAEMRTGKTLGYFQLMLQFPDRRCWIVAPAKVVKALKVEMAVWGFEHPHVELMTFNEMRKRVEQQATLTKQTLPYVLVIDEASGVKGDSKRTAAAIQLAHWMDDRWGKNESIRVLGTGTPQPKDYLDWYFLCEVARPGLLPWGNRHKFDEWLSVREKLVGLQGQEYWSRIQWKDGAPCLKCDGKGKRELKRPVGPPHVVDCKLCGGEGSHPDRVAELEWWLSQIHLVVLKKDVLELPDKEEVFVQCQPSATMLRVAKALTEQGLPAAEVLQRHRQLSDGFQYVRDPVLDDDGQPVLDDDGNEKFTVRVVRGKVNPKMKMVRGVLAAHNEVGRFVLYGAYTASIDWLCEVAEAEGWKVIRIDGKADVVPLWDRTLDSVDALLQFKAKSDGEKIAVIGHAKSMGYGFDLSASPGFGIYSMDYDGETYMQAIERGHGEGMDLELGCTLYYFECLPTDGFVRKNVTEKRDIQDVTVRHIQELYR